MSNVSVSFICDACGEPLTVTADTILLHDSGEICVRCLGCGAFKHFAKEEALKNEAIASVLSEAQTQR